MSSRNLVLQTEIEQVNSHMQLLLFDDSLAIFGSKSSNSIYLLQILIGGLRGLPLTPKVLCEPKWIFGL